jgi:single-strand DNA-binding protein
MAASFNKVMLMGNLTRDIEVRHVSGDMAVANFGLAVNRRFRTKDGEQREEVTFVDCEAWGRAAEIMSQYLKKGSGVFISGRLKLDTWQDKESGQNRSKLKVVVEEFQFVGGRGEESGGGGGGGGQRRPAGAPGGSRPAPAPQESYEPIGEEDIPF